MRDWINIVSGDLYFEWDCAMDKVSVFVIGCEYICGIMLVIASIFRLLGLNMYIDEPAIYGCGILGLVFGAWWIVLDLISKGLYMLWKKTL